MQTERSKKPRYRHSPAVGKSQYYSATSPDHLGWTGLLEIRIVDEDKFQILLNNVARYHGIWLSGVDLATRLQWLESIGMRVEPIVSGDAGRATKAKKVDEVNKATTPSKGGSRTV